MLRQMPRGFDRATATAAKERWSEQQRFEIFPA
jgi:hypothetical protein